MHDERIVWSSLATCTTSYAVDMFFVKGRSVISTAPRRGHTRQ